MPPVPPRSAPVCGLSEARDIHEPCDMNNILNQSISICKHPVLFDQNIFSFNCKMQISYNESGTGIIDSDGIHVSDAQLPVTHYRPRPFTLTTNQKDLLPSLLTEQESDDCRPSKLAHDHHTTEYISPKCKCLHLSIVTVPEHTRGKGCLLLCVAFGRCNVNPLACFPRFCSPHLDVTSMKQGLM